MVADQVGRFAVTDDGEMLVVVVCVQLGLQAMPQLVNDHLIQKYGLQSMVDRCVVHTARNGVAPGASVDVSGASRYMAGICKGVKRWHKRSIWIRVFGYMTGILDQEKCVPCASQSILVAQGSRRLYRAVLQFFSHPC